MYSREINGRNLTLSASGWTYNDTFVLFDYETESIWYHLEGTNGLTCINGFYADSTLAEFTSSQIRWNEWLASHPESAALKTTESGVF